MHGPHGRKIPIRRLHRSRHFRHPVDRRHLTFPHGTNRDEQLVESADRLRGFAVNRLAAGASVSRVVEQTGFSQRRFIQLFSEEVGLTPKLFSRVSRFQKVIRTAHRVDEINWAQVALDCGYYDQPHFVHDFRSFAGITPSEYLLRKTPHVNHVPME